jgi:hypothetical protein
MMPAIKKIASTNSAANVPEPGKLPFVNTSSLFLTNILWLTKILTRLVKNLIFRLQEINHEAFHQGKICCNGNDGPGNP